MSVITSPQKSHQHPQTVETPSNISTTHAINTPSPCCTPTTSTDIRSHVDEEAVLTSVSEQAIFTGKTEPLSNLNDGLISDRQQRRRARRQLERDAQMQLTISAPAEPDNDNQPSFRKIVDNKRKSSVLTDSSPSTSRPRKVMKKSNISGAMRALTLYVTHDNDDRSHISSEEATYVRGHLDDKICDATEAGEEIDVKVKSFGFTRGRARFICGDEPSLLWIKENVAALPARADSTVTYKAWTAHELPHLLKHTLFVPIHACRNIDRFVTLLKKRYKINDNDIRQWGISHKETGQTIVLGLSKDAMVCLQSCSMMPYIGLGQYEVIRRDEERPPLTATADTSAPQEVEVVTSHIDSDTISEQDTSDEGDI